MLITKTVPTTELPPWTNEIIPRQNINIGTSHQLTVSLIIEREDRPNENEFILKLIGLPLASIVGNQDENRKKGMTYIEFYEVRVEPTNNAILLQQLPESTNEQTYLVTNSSSEARSLGASLNAGFGGGIGSSTNSNGTSSSSINASSNVGAGVSANLNNSNSNSVAINEMDFKKALYRHENIAIWSVKIHSIYYNSQWSKYDSNNLEMLRVSKPNPLKPSRNRRLYEIQDVPLAARSSMKFKGSGLYKKNNTESESTFSVTVTITTIFVTIFSKVTEYNRILSDTDLEISAADSSESFFYFRVVHEITSNIKLGSGNKLELLDTVYSSTIKDGHKFGPDYGNSRCLLL